MENPLRTLLDDIKTGHRMSEDEALDLFRVRNRQVWEIAAAADEVREQRAVKCSYLCQEPEHQCDQSLCQCLRFLRFFKKTGDEGIYFHDKFAIQKKASLAKMREVSEICTVSGLHPDFNTRSYCDVYRWIHEAAPGSIFMQAIRWKWHMPQKKAK